METKFKDVANLYLGCEMIIESTGEKYIFKPSNMPSNWKDSHIRYGGKPILKHLFDLTYEDAILLDAEFFTTNYIKQSIIVDAINLDKQRFTVSDVNILLSKGYDLFNLIETGQAINAKTV